MVRRFPCLKCGRDILESDFPSDRSGERSAYCRYCSHPDTQHEFVWCSFHGQYERKEAFNPSQRSHGNWCRVGYAERRLERDKNVIALRPRTKKHTPTQEPEPTVSEPQTTSEVVYTCKYCNETKPESEFYKRSVRDVKRYKGGIACKSCERIYMTWYNIQPKDEKGRLLSRSRNVNRENFIQFLRAYRANNNQIPEQPDRQEPEYTIKTVEYVDSGGIFYRLKRLLRL